jgi:Tfp pilus assembly protein PilE
MIVVLIIGILLAIAVPQFMRAREQARAKQCIATLKQLDSAKEFYAHEFSLANGTACAMGDLWPIYIRRSTPPICSAGGVLNVQVIGTTPTCTVTLPIPHSL